MNKRLITLTIALAGVAALASAQDKSKQPSTVVVPKKNTVSPKEAAAIKKIQDAKSPQEVIAAVDAFVTDFPDSTFKAPALYEAAEAADQARDYPKAVVYGEESIQADPMRFDAMLLVAGELAQHTGKNDLDKKEKLDKAQKYVNQALMLVPNATKPAANVSDADWEAFKKDKIAEAHKDLGLIATANNDFKTAAAEYKTAVDTEATPDIVLMARLGNAYNETKQYSEADAVLTKVLATPNLNPQVKAFVDQEEARAKRGLSGK